MHNAEDLGPISNLKRVGIQPGTVPFLLRIPQAPPFTELFGRQFSNSGLLKLV